MESNKTNINVGDITSFSCDLPKKSGTPISIGNTIFHLYTVKEGPFKGNMGQVFRVHHKDWNVGLAMKQSILEDDGLKELFIEECDTWINLGLHPHIVSCYYVRDIEGTLSIFSEWMDGGNLKDFIGGGKGALYEDTPKEVLERILDIAIQTARGLDYAHKNNVIHRDVKPANILLLKDGSVKVGDFGISKTKGIAYTLAYRSPEQSIQNNPLTSKTDIWSWAATVLEMFVGGKPEEWCDGKELGKQWRIFAQRSCLQIPQQIEILIGECFEEDQTLRPDFEEIENRLLCIYKDITAHSYFRIKSQVVGNSADNLNNKALSFLDMGMPNEAETSWKQALNMGSNHQETVYNYSIYQWRNGKIDDRKVIQQIEWAQYENISIPYPLLEMINRERGISPENKTLEILSLENITAYVIWQNYLLVTQTYRKETNPKTHEERENWDPCIRLVQVWNLDDGTLIKEIPHKGGIIEKILANPNKSTAYLVSALGIFCWQDFMNTFSTNSTLEKVNIPHLTNFISPYTRNLSCISSDNRYLFLTRRGDVIFRWDLIKNSYRCMSLPKYCNVTFMRCSQDGRLFTIDNDKILRIWNIHSGRSIGNMKLESEVRSFDFCEEKNIMVINTYGGIYLLDMASYKPLKEIKLSGNIEIDAICFIRNGDLFATGEDRDIKIWDIESERCLLTLESDRYFIKHIEAYGDNCIVSISGSFTGDQYHLKVWDIPHFDNYKAPWILCQITSSHEKIKQEAHIRQISDEIRHLVEEGDITVAHKLFLSLCNIPGSAYSTGFVELQQLMLRYCRVVGLNACWKEKQYTLTYDESNSSNISSNAQYVVAGGERGSLQLWHIPSGKTNCLQENDRFSIRQLRFMKSNKQLLFSEWTPWIRRWHCETGEKIKEYMPDRRTNLVHFCLSLDERFLLAGGTNGTVFLLDVETGDCLETFKGNSSMVKDLCFSPDEQFFCVAYGDYQSSNDENIQIWDLHEKKCIGGFKASKHPIVLCDYGKTMICQDGWKGTIELRNIQSWEIVYRLEGHQTEIRSLSVSKDERYLLSGDDSGIIRLWDLHTGTCLKEIDTDYNSPVWEIHFSDDGSSFIYNVGANVYLWRLAWKLDFPDWADWDDNAFPYIKNFLIAYPEWTETDFERIITELQYKGYGWLKPDGVRAKLIELSVQIPMVSDFYKKKAGWDMPTVNKAILKIVKDSVEEIFNDLYAIHRPLLLGSGYSTSALSEAYGIHDVAIDSANAAYDAAYRVVNEAFPDVDVFDWINPDSSQYKQVKKQATEAVREAALEVINEGRRQRRLFLRDGTRSATILLACDYAKNRKNEIKNGKN